MSDNGHDWTSDLPEIDQELIKDLRLREARSLLWIGYYCGWRVDRGPGGFVIMTSADGQRIEIPNKDTINMNAFRQRARKIFRHRIINLPVTAMVQQVIDRTKIDQGHAQMLLRLASEVNAVGITEAQSQPESVPPAESGGSESEPAPVVTGKHRKRRILKEEPWSAHSGNTVDGVSTTYPSDAVMERTWNDGTTDYACRWDDCPYTNESPHSTARHNASHKRGLGKQPQADPDGVDPSYVPAKKARIRRLRSEINGALAAAAAQGIDFTVVDQAEWVATWIIDHRVIPLHPSSEEEAPTELTPEEALDKIATIADRGRNTILREQIDTLNGQVDGFMERLEEVAAAQAAAEARAKRAESNLRTYRELINDIAPPESDEPEATA